MQKSGISFLYAAILIFFGILLLKNISHPLLWNDESDTVMNGKHVLKYGYPKMTGDKHFIFLPDANDPTWIGYKHSYDANIAMPWGTFYFAAIPVWIADLTDDPYLKTAIIRTFFALAGIAGLFLFIITLKNFFPDKRTFTIVFTVFFLLCASSVPLLLHMREARYYSLIIFLISWFFYQVTRRYILNQDTGMRYSYSMFWILFFTYQVNVVSFAACAISLALFELNVFLPQFFNALPNHSERNKSWVALSKSTFKNTLPVFAAAIFITPFYFFNETSITIRRAYVHYGFSLDKYFENLQFIWNVLNTHDFLILALFLKAGMWMGSFAGLKDKGEINPSGSKIEFLKKFSLFTFLFSIVFSLLIARMPFFWTRYFIVLQPLLCLGILADSYVIFCFLKNIQQKAVKYSLSIFILAASAFSMYRPLGVKIKEGQDYAYQITHPFKGPLDFYLEFIKEKYPHPERIVVATNYEELCYMYYLDCKVTMGYVNKFYNTDINIQPDVIIFRKTWGHNPDPYRLLMSKAKYERVSFPIIDTRVNNIAEMDRGADLNHFFETRYTDQEDIKADLFYRVP